MSYDQNKGHSRGIDGDQKRGGVKNKPDKYKFLTEDQFQRLLAEIASDTANPNRYRDHAAIFCAFYFACRIKETTMLERECFQWLEDSIADIPTLKQRKIKGEKGRVPWKRPPQIETVVIDYLRDYLKSKMKPEQKYLFVSSRMDKPMSARTLDRIYNTYCKKAGISVNYTFHALRHGRGVYLYERFKDILLVRDMLRHASLKSTEIYMHLSPSKHSERQKLLDETSVKVKPLD